jgi:nitroreductase
MMMTRRRLLLRLCVVSDTKHDENDKGQHDGSTRTINPATITSATNMWNAIEYAIQRRYACTRFLRFDELETSQNKTVTTNTSNTPTITNTSYDQKKQRASSSDPQVIRDALEVLDLARRAPSGFNVQPYKVILVTTPQAKQAVAHACIGKNAHRVRDADCTAIFLADRQTLRTLKKYRALMIPRSQRHHDDEVEENPANSTSINITRCSPRSCRAWFSLLKLQVYIGLFSSGLPFPKIIAGPISWVMRWGIGLASLLVVNPLRRWWFSGAHILPPLPTLSSSETWSQKNTMLVAMTYLLGCTAKGWATCPMEGFNAPALKRALKLPQPDRYTIPLIVATGRPYPGRERLPPQDGGTDMVGISHGPASTKGATPRYPTDEVMFQDFFGSH